MLVSVIMLVVYLPVMEAYQQFCPRLYNNSNELKYFINCDIYFLII